MQSSNLEQSLSRLRTAYSAYRLRKAATRVREVLKYNPNWQLQPRAPVGVSAGGQWIVGLLTGVASLLPALTRVGLAAPRRLLDTGRRTAPRLRGVPRRWDYEQPGEDSYDEETRRISPWRILDLTRPTSEKSTSHLIESMLRSQERAGLAIRRDDVPAANRHLMKVWSLVDTLAERTDGRLALEGLLDHPMPDIRLRAAEGVKKWNLDKAIPVIGRLLFEDLRSLESPDERSDRISAGLQLYEHFHVRNYDRNELIGPLKAYGVDLPYYDHSRWQRPHAPA